MSDETDDLSADQRAIGVEPIDLSAIAGLRQVEPLTLDVRFVPAADADLSRLLGLGIRLDAEPRRFSVVHGALRLWRWDLWCAREVFTAEITEVARGADGEVSMALQPTGPPRTERAPAWMRLAVRLLAPPVAAWRRWRHGDEN